MEKRGKMSLRVRPGNGVKPSMAWARSTSDTNPSSNTSLLASPVMSEITSPDFTSSASRSLFITPVSATLPCQGAILRLCSAHSLRRFAPLNRVPSLARPLTREEGETIGLAFDVSRLSSPPREAKPHFGAFGTCGGIRRTERTTLTCTEKQPQCPSHRSSSRSAEPSF